MNTPPFDVMPLIAGALIHDRQHWRENAACHAQNLIRAIERGDKLHRRPIVPRSALVQELRETASLLRTSFEGDYYPQCEACGQMVYPDEVQVPAGEVDMHARCFGAAHARPGDRIAVPSSEVDVAEGESYAGYVTLFAQGTLFTDCQLSEILSAADAVLAQHGGRV